jgi:hypothetical protein
MNYNIFLSQKYYFNFNKCIKKFDLFKSCIFVTYGFTAWFHVMQIVFRSKVPLHKKSPTYESCLFFLVIFYSQTFKILDITHINRHFPFQDDILRSNKLGIRQFNRPIAFILSPDKVFPFLNKHTTEFSLCQQGLSHFLIWNWSTDLLFA